MSLPAAGTGYVSDSPQPGRDFGHWVSNFGLFEAQPRHYTYCRGRMTEARFYPRAVSRFETGAPTFVWLPRGKPAFATVRHGKPGIARIMADAWEVSLWMIKLIPNRATMLFTKSTK